MSITYLPEPRWKEVLPPRSFLIIHRDDGSLEIHVHNRKPILLAAPQTLRERDELQRLFADALDMTVDE